MIEEWTTAPGFTNYEVSSEGRVRRITSRTCGRAGAILKAAQHYGGYLQHGLTRDGKVITVRLSRLVCEAFHGTAPSSEHHAAHRDGDRLNNRSANLYWATRWENEADKTRHGTRRRGSQLKSAKLTERDALEIKARVRAKTATNKSLAAEYGVSSGLIGHIVHGRAWKHVET